MSFSRNLKEKASKVWEEGYNHQFATVFPCAWTYSDWSKRLKEQYGDMLEANFYRPWIEKYASDEFAEPFEWFYDTLDSLVNGMTNTQRNNIEEIFIRSVEFEYLFWDSAYNRQLSYER